MRNLTQGSGQRVWFQKAVVFSLTLALACCSSALAATVVVGTNDGPGNAFPFGAPAGSGFAYQGDYQQVYDSGQFSGPVTINSLAFASSSVNISSVSETLDLTISLSITSATLSSITSNYAANEGADNSQVYSGTSVFTPSNNNTFDLVFATSPFSYNPANGNLLMTVDIISDISSNVIAFDATSDAVTSRVFNPIGNGTPTVQEDYGLVTQFGTAASTPEPGSALLCLAGLMATGAFLWSRRDSSVHGVPASSSRDILIRLDCQPIKKKKHGSRGEHEQR